jgi:hypothetical protein
MLNLKQLQKPPGAHAIGFRHSRFDINANVNTVPGVMRANIIIVPMVLKTFGYKTRAFERMISLAPSSSTKPNRTRKLAAAK